MRNILRRAENERGNSRYSSTYNFFQVHSVFKNKGRKQSGAWGTVFGFDVSF